MDENSVDILLAGIDDEPGLVPLMVAFNQAEGIVWKPKSMTAALRRVLREDALGLILVARERTSCEIIGYGLATFGYDIEFAGRDAFITELFVEPANRGRGLGRHLLDSIVEKLREYGVGAVHLMVRPENVRARQLYESSGFRVAPRIMMTKQIEPK
jgi:ribosomal protein S18 acetylase RimI-like enzyme